MTRLVERSLGFVGLVGVVGACEQPLPEVSRVDCGQDYVAVEDLLVDLDSDEDGVLTAADLAPGESAAIVRWTGRAGPNGLAAATSRGAVVRASTSFDWDPVWGADIPMECAPVAQAGIAFYAPDRSTDALSVGPAEILTTSFAVIVDEMTEDEASVVVDGTVQLTDVSASTVSGHLQGTVSAGLFRRLGEVPWDQTYTVEAFAFRELEGTLDLR